MRFGNNFEIIFNPNQPDVIQVNVRNIGLVQNTINRDRERLEVEIYPRSGDTENYVNYAYAQEGDLDPDGVGEFGELPDEEIN